MRTLVFLTAILFLSACHNGARGPVGPSGPQGQQGEQGKPGLNIVAVSCAAPQGACGNNPDGSYVSGSVLLTAQDADGTGVYEENDPGQTRTLLCDGTNGAQGQQGPQGQQGSQGAAGQNATPITTVQFCAGYTTTYPTSFPEFGLCLNGNIYAVYWDGTNAWLSEAVPGYYKSTSTSAPCNFTIQANCQISH